MVCCFTEKRTVWAGTEKHNTTLQTLMNGKLNSFKDLGPLKHRHSEMIQRLLHGSMDDSNDIQQPKRLICKFQVRFPLLWIIINQDKSKSKVKGI